MPARRAAAQLAGTALDHGPQATPREAPLALVPIDLPALPLLGLGLRLTFGPALTADNLSENPPGLPHHGLGSLYLLEPGLAVVL
jgi:hypothetical protein